jgi:hypothetical protein
VPRRSDKSRRYAIKFRVPQLNSDLIARIKGFGLSCAT